ncbi:hypothetical protein [Rhizobium rhizogenes]
MEKVAINFGKASLAHVDGIGHVAALTSSLGIGGDTIKAAVGVVLEMATAWAIIASPSNALPQGAKKEISEAEDATTA